MAHWNCEYHDVLLYDVLYYLRLGTVPQKKNFLVNYSWYLWVGYTTNCHGIYKFHV